MAVTTCTQEGCTGHLGKFDSCLDEALYDLSMDPDDSTGDTDWEGHYALVVVRAAGECTEIADGRTIDVPAGTYIVFTAPQGFVSVTTYEDEVEARMVFDAIDDRYQAACDQEVGA